MAEQGLIFEPRKEKRVIVCGSRHWRDRQTIINRLRALPADTIIVVGYDGEKKRPKGADEITFEEATRIGLAIELYPAHWEQYGKGAGFKRNKEMAEGGARLCLAFWDGLSTGTFDMMAQAVKRGIPVEVVHEVVP